MPQPLTRPNTIASRSSQVENGDAMSRLSQFVPEPPATLKPVGRARWYQIADIMVGRGTWSLDWVPALEHACITWDQLAIVEVMISKLDSYIVYSNNGIPKTHPLLTERGKLASFLQNQLNCFNLTPITARAAFKSGLGKLPKASMPALNKSQVNFQED